jgi:methionyl-tRNA synthetase
VRRYLVTTTYHTPSGPLHLGHIGGPFLNADVIARALEMHGHDVMRVSATDARESYVYLASLNLGTEPETVATYYHAQAHSVIEAFGMPQASFINTHLPGFRERYLWWSRHIEQELVDGGHIKHRPITYLQSEKTGRFLVGGLVLGRCPRCDQEVAGTSCEECGLWFPLADIENPHGRLPEDSLVRIVAGEESVLDASDSFTAANIATRFPNSHHHLYDAYVSYNGTALSLTHPLPWGVPWLATTIQPGAVHSSYGIGAHASMRMIGEECIRLYGADPFDAHSGITKITTGGLDATLPWMFHTAFIRSHDAWRPIDIHVLTHFMTLQGEKFSTSRGHAIWAHDYVETGLPVDSLRFYLAKISPSRGRTDFNIDEFEQTSTWLDQRLMRTAVHAAQADPVRDPLVWPPPLDGTYQSLIRILDFLEPDHFDLAAWCVHFREWIDSSAADDLSRNHPVLWLRAVAAAAYPVMPVWAESLWQLSGLDLPVRTEAVQLASAAPIDRGASLPHLRVDGQAVRRLVGRPIPRTVQA